MPETLAVRLDMCVVSAQTGEAMVLTEANGERRQRFDALFCEHIEGIASYCRWRSRGDAEDAVAEVFLVAWRRLDDVPAVDDARPWLYATARRVIANQPVERHAEAG